MTSDPYIFFTGCHRLYIQGARRAFQDRLRSAFGDDWWVRGVEHAVTEDQRENLKAEIERNRDRERHLLLDASHFSGIIAKHHNEIFSDAFPDSIRTIRDLRRLVGLRNEWAHIQDISFVRARQAADVMKHILASLSCEEALEIERMSQDLDFDPGSASPEDSIEELDHSDDGLDSREPTIEQRSFWHQLQSYLVVEKTVEPSNQSNGQARVFLRVHNTAPDSKDWPAVHFKSVTISNSAHGGKNLGDLPPGKTAEVEFTFPAKQLLTVDFAVGGEIDADRLFQFSRTTSLPQEVIAPLQREFAARIESIAIRAFVDEVLGAIGAPDPTMSLADVARLRESLKMRSERVKEKLTALNEVYREFKLNRNSQLGARLRGVSRTLNEFGERLVALDEAIGRTDLESINDAVQNLKQVHLAVLRVEDTLKVMTASA